MDALEPTGQREAGGPSGNEANERRGMNKGQLGSMSSPTPASSVMTFLEQYLFLLALGKGEGWKEVA